MKEEEGTNMRANEWMNERTNEWINERINDEWMSEWMDSAVDIMGGAYANEDTRSCYFSRARGIDR